MIQKQLVQKIICSLAFLGILAILIVGLEDTMFLLSKYNRLTPELIYTDEFRGQIMTEQDYQKICSLSKSLELPFSDVLSVFHCASGFRMEDGITIDKANYETLSKELLSTRKDVFQEYHNWYERLYQEAVYFPVVLSSSHKDYTVSFENSWMFERTYGGKRGHEGTDIMADVNERGLYPIISMTDGVVEKIGWLPKGGYRIGIRSAGDIYYYYAHLERYAKDFKEGETIHAGDLLGFMGDSGYSDVEGTVGKFPVHLHFGIYIRTEDVEELSLNPYWILRQLEDNTLLYRY